MSAPLQGLKLLLTRTREDARDWVERLAAEGAETVVEPCIAGEMVADPTLGARLADALQRADWLLFTSRRGVDALAEMLHNRLPDKLQIATVGAVTAARVAEHFGRVAHAGRGTAATLGNGLVEDGLVGPGTNCVLALAANAPDTLERILRGAGAAVSRFDVYRAVPAPPVEHKRPLSDFGCDIVLFASPSAVAGFANRVEVDTDVQMVTIGPSTSAAVRMQGWQVAAEAREPGLAGVIESILEMKRV